MKKNYRKNYGKIKKSIKMMGDTFNLFFIHCVRNTLKKCLR